MKGRCTISSTAIGAEWGRMEHSQFRHPVTPGTFCSLSGLRVT